MRKIVIGLLALSTILVAFAGEASAASANPYSLLPGGSMTFIVQGTSASLIPVTGDASNTQPAPFLGVLSKVTVSCAASSALPCTGLLVVT